MLLLLDSILGLHSCVGRQVHGMTGDQLASTGWCWCTIDSRSGHMQIPDLTFEGHSPMPLSELQQYSSSRSCLLQHVTQGEAVSTTCVVDPVIRNTGAPSLVRNGVLVVLAHCLFLHSGTTCFFKNQSSEIFT